MKKYAIIKRLDRHGKGHWQAHTYGWMFKAFGPSPRSTDTFIYSFVSAEDCKQCLKNKLSAKPKEYEIIEIVEL